MEKEREYYSAETVGTLAGGLSSMKVAPYVVQRVGIHLIVNHIEISLFTQYLIEYAVSAGVIAAGMLMGKACGALIDAYRNENANEIAGLQ